MVALGLGACTYSREEPGLFRTTGPSPGRPQVSRLPPQKTNPALPVLAEAVWTTGEGLQVTNRFAVHAVRRIPGATVLDWSVTPLSAPGLQVGDSLPAWVDLGLTRETGGDLDAFLIDARAGKVYRPLAHRSQREFNRCLCSPLWVAQLSLHIGETRMLQVSYPELPSDLTYVDVMLTNAIPFWHVPVTPTGRVPSATQPTDLARPPTAPAPASPARAFSYPRPQQGRSQSIQVQQIVSAGPFTSMQWTLTSLTDQPSFSLIPYGLPVSGDSPYEGDVLNPGSANGPQIQAGRTRLQARWMTARLQNATYVECLCTDLGLWASTLREAGGHVSVVTNLGALPPKTTAVDVILPSVGTLKGVPVKPGEDSARRAGPAVDDGHPDRWTYDPATPPPGWSTVDWPTPTPAARQLPDYAGTVEDLITRPGR